MSAGFTPGPWDFHSGYLIRKCEDELCVPIAEMRAPYRKQVGLVRGYREEWHNGHLIAAAPDLYTACEATLLAIVNANNGKYTFGDLVRQIQAALSKARGIASEVSSVGGLK